MPFVKLCTQHSCTVSFFLNIFHFIVLHGVGWGALTTASIDVNNQMIWNKEIRGSFHKEGIFFLKKAKPFFSEFFFYKCLELVYCKIYFNLAKICTMLQRFKLKQRFVIKFLRAEKCKLYEIYRKMCTGKHCFSQKMFRKGTGVFSWCNC